MNKIYAERLRENEKYEMGRNPENKSRWEDTFTSLLASLINVHQTNTTVCHPLPLYAKTVSGDFRPNSLCPYVQHIRIDALNRQDYPNNIAENSVYVTIKIDLEDKTFEISDSGHIWLNRAEQKATNYAMASMKRIVTANGGKWLRKSKFKDAKDFAKKVTKFWELAMTIIDSQTGGYPYKGLRDDATPVYKVA